MRGVSHEEVLGVNVGVLGEVEVLLGHEYTLLEEVLVDLLAISLWDKPAPAVSSCALPTLVAIHTLSRVPGALRGIVHNARICRMSCGCGCRKRGPRQLLVAVPREGATVGLAIFSGKIVVPSHTLESTTDFRSKCVTTDDDYTL